MQQHIGTTTSTLLFNAVYPNDWMGFGWQSHRQKWAMMTKGVLCVINRKLNIFYHRISAWCGSPQNGNAAQVHAIGWLMQKCLCFAMKRPIDLKLITKMMSSCWNAVVLLLPCNSIDLMANISHFHFNFCMCIQYSLVYYSFQKFHLYLFQRHNHGNMHRIFATGTWFKWIYLWPRISDAKGWCVSSDCVKNLISSYSIWNFYKVRI